jgi:hypothetical protein
VGRTLGIILIIVGIGAGAIIGVLMAVFSSSGDLSTGGAALGVALGGLVIVLPLVGAGIFFVVQGGREQEVREQRRLQRKLLDTVKTQGQIPISDLSIELGTSRNETRDMLYTLVGLELFSGYVNWDEGVLYSQEASQLRELERCNICQGQLELAGKGVIRCPYCGTEYFLD